MRIEGFIWLDEIIEKLAQKHHVSVCEVEEVFTNEPYFRFISKGRRQ